MNLNQLRCAFAAIFLALLSGCATGGKTNSSTSTEGQRSPSQVSSAAAAASADDQTGGGVISTQAPTLSHTHAQANGDATASAQHPQRPFCGAIGTRSEGWIIPGEKIRYDRCAGKGVECGAIGTRSEGWYIFEKQKVTRLKYATCSVAKEFPVCVGVGTRSEGWEIPGEKIRYDHCADKGVECGAIGTRSEGWYTYEKQAAGFLKYDTCANK